MNQRFYFLLTVLTVCTSLAHAQNCVIKKGYAYERTTIPGNIPRNDLDESGNQMERPQKNSNTYFIYIEVRPDCKIQVTRIWIAEKAYLVTLEEITKKPVIIQHAHPGTPADTLVKKTGNKVLRLQLKEELTMRPAKKLASKITATKILVECTNNSNTHYYSIDEIKRIAPLVLQ